MFTGSTKMYLSAIVQMSIGNEEKKKTRNSSSRQARGIGGRSFNSSVLAISTCAAVLKAVPLVTFMNTVGILCAPWCGDRPPCSCLLELSTREREGG